MVNETKYSLWVMSDETSYLYNDKINSSKNSGNIVHVQCILLAVFKSSSLKQTSQLKGWYQLFCW